LKIFWDELNLIWICMCWCSFQICDWFKYGLTCLWFAFGKSYWRFEKGNYEYFAKLLCWDSFFEYLLLICALCFM